MDFQGHFMARCFTLAVPYSGLQRPCTHLLIVGAIYQQLIFQRQVVKRDSF